MKRIIDTVPDAQRVLTEVLARAEAQNYSGYSKFDALNSPLLSRLSFGNKWLRLIYTQAVKASPLHIRPLLGVAKSRNPKGIALFARAYFHVYQQTGDARYLEKGEQLVQWLLDNPSPGQQNLCWGYNHVWQNTIFLQDKYEPNTVVSLFVGEALVHAYRVTRKDAYLQAARSLTHFITDDLPVLRDTGTERALAYVLRPVDAIVLNNQVLAGAFLIKVWHHTQEAALRDTASRLINFTVNRKTDYDAWYYTWPRTKSPITHDNYHTGGILDGLLEYFEETGDDRYLDTYWKGLAFYRARLFESDGAPRWMHDKKYPHDVHGAAQGIITLRKAARHDPEQAHPARRIAGWALENLYRVDRQEFIYRKGRFFDWNYSLMRWCNAWMARALAELQRNDGT